VTIVVSALAVAPIKGTRLREAERIDLKRDGVRENRRFYLIDARGRMVNGKHIGELSAIVAEYCEGSRALSLTFPDGRVVSDQVELGEVLDTRFYSQPQRVPEVVGPWSAAISDFVGKPLRLVQAEFAGGAVDRGGGGVVSLISRESLSRLAREGGESELDAKRFRMLIEIDGVEAHEEDRWVGARVRIGEATVTFKGHVGRCLITSRHPETGTIDLPTLELLKNYRGELPTSEPLPFGIYGEVREEGAIAVGDVVVPAGRG
jgi:uncharacterized protein